MFDSQPNILLILTDQQRQDTLAKVASNPWIQTPSLDRLAERGVWFEAMYSEMPECVPARSVILTGKMGHVTGVMGNNRRLGGESPTIAHALSQAGYHTQAIGKMHFSPVRASHGFADLRLAEEIPTQIDEDDYLSFLVNSPYAHVLEPHGIRHEYYYIPQVSQLPDDLHATTWIGQETVKFLQHPPQQPFFLYTSFIKPHPPFEPTLPYAFRYDPAQLPDPVDWSPAADPAGLELLRAQDYSKWMEATDLNLAHLIKAAYYACVTQVDVQIGRILDALDRSGLAQETLVIFSSDHGELLGDHHHFGKRSFYHGSTRVPLILSWPGTLPQGQVRQSVVGHQDFYQAMAEAAGLTQDSRLLSIAKTGEKDEARLLVGELFEDERAIYMAVDRRWKYLYSPNGGRECLLAVDAQDHETQDYLTSHPDQANSMRKRLIQYFQREGYAPALDSEGADLCHLPDTTMSWPRNRQYPVWQKGAVHRTS